MKIDIRQLTFDELADFFATKDEKKFRARQVQEWLWQKSSVDFDEMSNLSLNIRQVLKDNFVINNITIDHSQHSKDGTIKSAFKLHDDHVIEGVLIPTQKRLTACISSQVGCSLSCKFCATGFMERKRNLEAGEIYDQVVLINQQALEKFGKPLTNIVYMGMGEPLLNFQNVLKSIQLITSPEGLHMAAHRITLSTAGVAKMIEKLGTEKVRVNLALSLHAADDEKRNLIMPINESNSLNTLKKALRYYYDQTGNEITLEYILFNKFNDSMEDARNLVNFSKSVPSKVNIIEYNTVQGANFNRANPESTEKFRDYLEKHRVNVHVRRSRGKDIDAACGQLANKS